MSNTEALRAALKALLDRYTDLVNSGDAGRWNPEREQQVIDARAALAQPAASGEPAQQQPTSPDVRAALLFALYHHQGASSKIGQPIRHALGIAQHAPLTDEQCAEATRVDLALLASAQPAPARVPLTDQQLCSMRKENLADDDSPAWAYEKGVRDAENAHGVTQGEPK